MSLETVWVLLIVSALHGRPEEYYSVYNLEENCRRFAQVNQEILTAGQRFDCREVVPYDARRRRS